MGGFSIAGYRGRVWVRVVFQLHWPAMPRLASVGSFMSVVCSFGGSSSSVCTSAMSLKSNGLHVLAASC